MKTIKKQDCHVASAPRNDIEIVFVDERYTSIEAEAINREKVDEVAACMILQRYINNKGESL